MRECPNTNTATPVRALHYLIVNAEGECAAHGGQVKQMQRRQTVLLLLLLLLILLLLLLLLVLLLPELYDLVRVAHRLQHAQTRSRAHVRRKADLNSESKRTLQREQPAAQERVGGGAEGDAGASC